MEFIRHYRMMVCRPTNPNRLQIQKSVRQKRKLKRPKKPQETVETRHRGRKKRKGRLEPKPKKGRITKVRHVRIET